MNLQLNMRDPRSTVFIKIICSPPKSYETIPINDAFIKILFSQIY